MQWPWTKRQAPSAFRIRECLDAERADLAVSEWLDRRENEESLPAEVRAAYWADTFLRDVNGDGLIGFLTSNFGSLQEAREGIASVGLNDSLAAIDDALELLGFAGLPADEDAFGEAVADLLDDEGRSDAVDRLDQKQIDSSAHIAAAIHAYIRSHISAFELLE